MHESVATLFVRQGDFTGSVKYTFQNLSLDSHQWLRKNEPELENLLALYTPYFSLLELSPYLEFYTLSYQTRWGRLISKGCPKKTRPPKSLKSCKFKTLQWENLSVI